ncbi:hypothetical protein DRJ22_01290 [Candidatus Woesearchaeota archaeon]|nr:MAG: hypothetical protein DRJ22_01290 [Candidatus Woesearchaeota archaeon]
MSEEPEKPIEERLLQKKTEEAKEDPLKKQLENLIIEKKLKQKEIAATLGISVYEVSNLLGKYNLRNIYHQIQREQPKKKLQELIENGLTPKEIAQKMGRPQKQIYQMILSSGLKETYNLKQKEKELEIKSRLIEIIEGPEQLTLQEISNHFGKSTTWLSSFLKKHDLKRLWKVNQKRKRKLQKKQQKVEQIEELIEQGLTQREIAKRFNITHQRISQIIRESCLYEKWKETKISKRNEKKRYKKIKQELIFMILHQTAKREQNIPFQKALEYKYSSKKSIRETLETLTKFFDLCYSGKTYTITALSKETGLTEQIIGYILRKMPEVPRPYKLRQRTVLRKEQEELIKRASETELNIRDISYFLKLPLYVISKRLKSNTKESYRLPSQIYEAQDLGFTIKEIAELLDIKEDKVKKELELRAEKEPKIKQALTQIYQKKFEKPYL